MNDQCHLQCNCPSATTSVYQTLDEMTFERGIWSAALSGQVDEVKKCLTKGGDCVNSKDKYGYTALVSLLVLLSIYHCGKHWNGIILSAYGKDFTGIDTMHWMDFHSRFHLI